MRLLILLRLKALRQKSAVLQLVVLLLIAPPAFAYRPFDSTDASVAGRGELELECGPVGYLVDGEERFLITPAAVLNVGVYEGWEIVVEGKNFVAVDSGPHQPHASFRDAAFSVKGVLRQGALQDQAGPSVAVEVGLLLPETGGGSSVGSSVAGIVSQRWKDMTVHVNGAFFWSRDHQAGQFGGLIVEGPNRWRVRPVGEVTIEHEDGSGVAALGGLIWRLGGNLSFDAAWRFERSVDVTGRELRAGFTWAFPLTSSTGSNGATRTGRQGWRPRV